MVVDDLSCFYSDHGPILLSMILKFSVYIPAKSWLKKSTKGQMSLPRTDTPVS